MLIGIAQEKACAWRSWKSKGQEKAAHPHRSTDDLYQSLDPTLCCYYKSSRIKQYFKEGRALRTETVICNTQDFGIGRRVCAKNWNALRAVGESANRRLCDAESADALPTPDMVTFHLVTRPSNTEDGLYARLATAWRQLDGALDDFQTANFSRLEGLKI